MADLTDRIAEAPLTADDGGGWAGPCLALRCTGTRRPDAWGTDGTQALAVTACDRCERIEVEPAPHGLEQDALPGMEDADG